MRHHSEADSDQWADRLKIVGTDFRTAKDAFRLVVVVTKLLSEWPEGGRPRKLNVLINNAAQTLTDPLQSKSKDVHREQLLRDDPAHGRLLVEGDRGYDPKVRGGMQLTWAAGCKDIIGWKSEAQLPNRPVLIVRIHRKNGFVARRTRTPRRRNLRGVRPWMRFPMRT